MFTYEKGISTLWSSSCVYEGMFICFILKVNIVKIIIEKYLFKM